MDYSSTVEFLFSKLPYFTRDGKAAIKNDLNNTIALCQFLGHPEKQFKCIHIAGTNGKGSCSNMLAAVLQMHGYKTGLYTSPHLVDFRERIRINGNMIPEQAVIDFVEKIKDQIEIIQPSFF
jgi:dihydrofolate synthase/folylpolyglutamate synthase